VLCCAAAAADGDDDAELGLASSLHRQQFPAGRLFNLQWRFVAAAGGLARASWEPLSFYVTRLSSVISDLSLLVP